MDVDSDYKADSMFLYMQLYTSLPVTGCQLDRKLIEQDLKPDARIADSKQSLSRR